MHGCGLKRPYVTAHARIGSKPPCSRFEAEQRPQARRVPPPLRFGAALVCVVSGLETSRDVGLAKSGFLLTVLGERRSIARHKAANGPLEVSARPTGTSIA